MDKNDDFEPGDQDNDGCRGAAIGCVVFALAFVFCLPVIGLFVSQYARRSLENMPREEVYNAIARDSEAMKFAAISVGVSLLAAAAIAALAVCRRPGRR